MDLYLIDNYVIRSVVMGIRSIAHFGANVEYFNGFEGCFLEKCSNLNNNGKLSLLKYSTVFVEMFYR